MMNKKEASSEKQHLRREELLEESSGQMKQNRAVWSQFLEIWLEKCWNTSTSVKHGGGSMMPWGHLLKVEPVH